MELKDPVTIGKPFLLSMIPQADARMVTVQDREKVLRKRCMQSVVCGFHRLISGMSF
jgi:hypothetical protein